MRKGTLALAGLILSIHTAAAAPTTPAKPVPFAPVPGGFSDRLAPLARSLEKGGDAFQTQLSTTLAKSRQEAHDMIDKIIEEGKLDEWLKAMGREKGDGFAESLAGKDPEVVRRALHSRIDRKLAKLGKTIGSGLQETPIEKLRTSYGAAVDHLAKEETHLMEAAHQVDIETAEVPAAPATSAPPEGAPAAPAGSPASPWVNPYSAYGRGGHRAMNAYYQGGMPPSMMRTMNVARQRAWFQGQMAAARWNSSVRGFNTYLYGRAQPWYSNPRYRRRGFPAGYYYRPDRVERVVRRGLWGAAAVAATPFALVASIF